MKTKVTLTIDKELIPRAKNYARIHGHSLSQLIENSLKKMSLEQEQPFSKKWRGKFEKSNRSTPRYKILEKRYL